MIADETKEKRDEKNQIVWTAFCTEGCGCINTMANGGFAEAHARIHAHETGHSTIVGVTMERC